MRGPFKPLLTGEQKFPAPNRPVETVTGAIPRNTESWRLDFVFSHARKHMRPMMLHRMDGRSRLRGIFCGKIVGMSITSDESRRGFVEPRKILRGGSESGIGLAGGKVADMLADENFRANTEGHGIF